MGGTRVPPPPPPRWFADGSGAAFFVGWFRRGRGGWPRGGAGSGGWRAPLGGGSAGRGSCGHSPRARQTRFVCTHTDKARGQGLAGVEVRVGPRTWPRAGGSPPMRDRAMIGQPAADAVATNTAISRLRGFGVTMSPVSAESLPNSPLHPSLRRGAPAAATRQRRPAPGYREPPMTRVRPPQGRPPPTYPPGRYCATGNCTARLSIYNPTDHCRLHSPRRYPRKLNRRGW